MSNERRGARQMGAPALTLTRRQQKRARKQKYQRRTAPPAARQTATAQTAQQKTQRATAHQAVVVGTTARETMPAAESAMRPVRAQPRRENVTPEPKEVKRREKLEAAAQPETRRDDVKRRPALRAIRREATVTGTRDETHVETQPEIKPLKVSKRTRPISTMHVARAGDSPSASGRRYPTLAHMAAAKQRPETADSGQAREPEDLLPWEIGEQQQAKPRRIWTAPNGVAPVGSADEQETGLVATVARQPRPARQAVPTRRLRDEMEHASEAQPLRGESRAKIRVPRLARPAPLPRVDLTVSVAVAHAGIAAAAALTGAGMLVLGAPGALWPLSLMAIAGAGGWLAYGLAQHGDMRRIAGVVLMLSQLAALGWLLALLGPRAALLAVVPALALLALRTGGQGAAIEAGAAALALFAGYTVLTLNGLLTPGIRLDAEAQALVDVVAVAAGLGVTLYAASRVASAGSRVEAAALARLHEARLLRARLAQLQQQVEDDGERLDAGLAQALHGNGIPPVAAEGALSPLAETVNATAERLKTLQRDREDRLRLEGAMRAVTRAVERAWLGLPWSWPEWSGTPMDELVALLRTPRPREAQESWSEETPTLLQLPTLDRMMTPLPWEHDETAPVYPVYPYVAKAANGWSQPLGWPQTAGRMPAQPGGQIEQMEQMGQVTPLPWNEWNQWPDWEG